MPGPPTCANGFSHDWGKGRSLFEREVAAWRCYLFPKLLGRLRERDENRIDIEAKTARDLGESALETISAFANEPGRGGGYLLFGVSWEHAPTGGRYVVNGVPNADKLQSDLASACATVFNVPVRPQICVDIDPESSRRVVVAHVSEAPATEKPVYLRARGLPRGAFRRIGASDIVCTEDDLHVLFHLRGTKSYDETPVDDAVWADLDPQVFRVYRHLRAELNPAAVELDYDDLARCPGTPRRGPQGDGVGADSCRTSPLWYETSLAAFLPDPPHRLSADRRQGVGPKIPGALSSIGGLKSGREPLLLAIPQVVSHIMDDIPKSMSLPGRAASSARNSPCPVPAPVREAVVNAVMHRNYHTQQPTQILCAYSNRLEFRNAVPFPQAGRFAREPGSVLAEQARGIARRAATRLRSPKPRVRAFASSATRW